jgi:hypothetical protein
MEVKFETWAFIELFGYTKIAGKVSEQTFGNQSLIRIDVPEVEGLPAYSKLVGVSSIFSITPMAEEDARRYANQLKVKPLDSWDMNQIFQEKLEELIKKGKLQYPQLATTEEDE